MKTIRDAFKNKMSLIGLTIDHEIVAIKLLSYNLKDKLYNHSSYIPTSEGR